jgi:hypothetical protein
MMHGTTSIKKNYTYQNFYEIYQQEIINLRTRYQELYKLANMSKYVVHNTTY